MRGYDVLLLAAIFATLLLTLVGQTVQKYWRLFDVFIGKKHGLWVYAGMVAVGWAEVLVTSVFDLRSEWQFNALWFLGLSVVAVSVWLFVMSVREAGKGTLVSAQFFGRKLAKHGQLQKKLKFPLYISVVSFFVGVCLITGKYGFLTASATLLIGFALKTLADRPRKVVKR